MPYSEPIPVEDATSLVIPGEWDDVLHGYTGSGPWQWADPILAIASDSWKWRDWPEHSAKHGPFSFRVGQSAIENLYRSGYALVKVLPDPIGWRDTETGWRESTDGKWATAWAEGEGPGDCPVCEITDPHAHALRPGGSVDPTRTLSLTEAVQ